MKVIHFSFYGENSIHSTATYSASGIYIPSEKAVLIKGIDGMFGRPEYNIITKGERFTEIEALARGE